MGKSLLVIWKILRLFVNTFTADEKYFLLNRDNLTELIQMRLSPKQKTYYQLFAEVSKSRLIFVHFQNKDDPHSYSVAEIKHSQRGV